VLIFKVLANILFEHANSLKLVEVFVFY